MAPLDELTLTLSADAVTAATPLASLRQGTLPEETLEQLFLGQNAGSLGEASALMLLVGGCYLILRKVISPPIPAYYLGTVAVLSMLTCPAGGGAAGLGGVSAAQRRPDAGRVLHGNTDYVTSPVTQLGPDATPSAAARSPCSSAPSALSEGVCYAILIMNTTVCLVDRVLRPRPFGLAGRGPRRIRLRKRRGQMKNKKAPPRGKRIPMWRLRQGFSLLLVLAVTLIGLTALHWLTQNRVVTWEWEQNKAQLAQVMPEADAFFCHPI